MARSVVWALEALDDVDAIAEYISRDSLHHARRVVEAIFALMDTLATQPYMGRVVPELGSETVREHFIFSFRIIYEITDSDLQVVAVIHGKRLLESVSDRFVE